MSGFWVYSQIDKEIKQLFTVTSVQYRPMSKSASPLQSDMVPVYEVLRRSDMELNIKQANKTLNELGYLTLIRPHPTEESRGMLYIFPMTQKMKSQKQNYTTPLILFGLTIFSVFTVGMMLWGDLTQVQTTLNPIILGIYYVISLMGIVSVHEFGHMVASYRHGIKASLPYFIPIPIGLGTLGAFISQKTPIKSRNDLFDIGLSGPFFGFVASIFFTIIGLLNSYVIPAAIAPTNLTEATGLFDLKLDSPERLRILIFELFAYILVPQVGPSYIIYLHPFAYAGFIGFLLTGLNLIPIGQSDGGHVARSLFSEKQHRYVTYISAGLLVMINTGFFIFALLLLFMYSQTGHSGPLDDLTLVGLPRKLVTIGALILLIFCIPTPPDFFSTLFPILG
ncbi:MAG: site-2 protease family protein [Candidatus Hodarchaeales archaeon]|jgi:membrane-associated protease RseP (regulator of RpoE activity)